MKSSKNFNNVSKELLALVPKLKPGEVVVFQMLNGTPNPEPDEKERSKSPVLYGKVQVLTNFRIFDKFANDNAGAFVDVGCVDQWNGDNPVRFRLFVPGMGEFAQFQGKFQLMGGNVRDEELYEILWLSPQREGSPCADASIAPIFKILNLKEESNQKLNKVKILGEAITVSREISFEDSVVVLAALNQPSYQDKEVVSAKIAELASSDPETFLSTYKDPATKVKGAVRKALDADIIKHDIATGNVTVGKTQLANIKVQTADDFVSEFSRFLMTAENGTSVLNNIKEQLKQAKVAST